MSSRPPLIGLTTYGRDEGNRFALPAEYVDAVRRAGAVPLLLPPGEPAGDAWLDLLDAVILTGGGDIDPRSYGGCDHESVYMVDHERDTTELDLASRVLGRDLPVLAICRGAQLVNVARGGSLWEHVPDRFGDAVAHRLPPREPTPHDVEVDEGSRVAGAFGATRFSAMSWHHQAVREVGSGLVVVARAPDGVVEALEMPSHPWLLAVQWHPELTAASDPVQQRIFGALAAAALARRRRSRAAESPRGSEEAP